MLTTDDVSDCTVAPAFKAVKAYLVQTSAGKQIVSRKKINFKFQKKSAKKGSPKGDSNPQPLASEANALSIGLLGPNS